MQGLVNLRRKTSRPRPRPRPTIKNCPTKLSLGSTHGASTTPVLGLTTSQVLPKLMHTFSIGKCTPATRSRKTCITRPTPISSSPPARLGPPPPSLLSMSTRRPPVSRPVPPSSIRQLSSTS
ncbi:hypothetical protein EXIGLDRAFT_402770 [Exidia glandulosa HHB12029]|uniref:Uncharacterized protein n=1 Tax=Exidia glandulosa HHB12029 TaxID=1314781 RepID=A0A165BK40_EXIGL|nr:hypothetical protein EXIGLDRAFT_402770 [Exidia glandulosa HHB12029]